jgi:hypothetical protein
LPCFNIVLASLAILRVNFLKMCFLSLPIESALGAVKYGCLSSMIGCAEEEEGRSSMVIEF